MANIECWPCDKFVHVFLRMSERCSKLRRSGRSSKCWLLDAPNEPFKFFKSILQVGRCSKYRSDAPNLWILVRCFQLQSDAPNWCGCSKLTKDSWESYRIWVLVRSIPFFWFYFWSDGICSKLWIPNHLIYMLVYNDRDILMTLSRNSRTVRTSVLYGRMLQIR